MNITARGKLFLNIFIRNCNLSAGCYFEYLKENKENVMEKVHKFKEEGKEEVRKFKGDLFYGINN